MTYCIFNWWILFWKTIKKISSPILLLLHIFVVNQIVYIISVSKSRVDRAEKIKRFHTLHFSDMFCFTQNVNIKIIRSFQSQSIQNDAKSYTLNSNTEFVSQWTFAINFPLIYLAWMDVITHSMPSIVTIKTQKITTLFLVRILLSKWTKLKNEMFFMICVLIIQNNNNL